MFCAAKQGLTLLFLKGQSEFFEEVLLMFMFRAHCGAESSVLEGRLIAVEAKKVKLNANESKQSCSVGDKTNRRPAEKRRHHHQHSLNNLMKNA